MVNELIELRDRVAALESLRTHPIVLNDYQVANLRALLELCGGWGGIEMPNPFSAANTGDWVAEIYYKLPRVPREPNVSPAEMMRRANEWIARREP